MKMEMGGFVSWDDFDVPAMLSRCRCSLCIGGIRMPTEEEIEERVNDSLDDKHRELKIARAAVRKDQLKEILEKAVSENDYHVSGV
jgi:hypothetical protein